MDPKDLRSPSVSLKDINFRVNRQFKKDIESEIELQRYHSPFRVKNPLDRERCLQRLEKVLGRPSVHQPSGLCYACGKNEDTGIAGYQCFYQRWCLEEVWFRAFCSLYKVGLV